MKGGLNIQWHPSKQWISYNCWLRERASRSYSFLEFTSLFWSRKKHNKYTLCACRMRYSVPPYYCLQYWGSEHEKKHTTWEKQKRIRYLLDSISFLPRRYYDFRSMKKLYYVEANIVMTMVAFLIRLYWMKKSTYLG